MGWGIVFGEDAGAVVGGEDQNCVDGEEGHVGRHFCGGKGVGWGVWEWEMGIITRCRPAVVEALF